MKQHAFIFQVHKQPELFSRIVRRLDSGNHHFFVNVDAKVKNPNDFESSVKDVANVHFMSPRWNVHHGGRSQYLCTLDLLRMVKRMLPDYAFVHSLSGQDYPLRSNAEFDSFFEKTDKGFMAIEDDEYNAECMSGKYPMRVNLWHFNNPHTFIARVYNHSVLRQIISRLVQRPDVQGLRGWSWFTWTPAIVDYVLEYIESHPEYLARFNHTYCADELIFATILHPVADELNLDERHPLRYVSWKPGRRTSDVGTRRPYTLNEEDFDDVMSSDAFFCRKVELPESARLLDMIDESMRI